MSEFRVVPDTNVLISSQISKNPTSPSKEIFSRWQKGQFTLLYSRSTIREYAIKLHEKGIEPQKIKRILGAIVSRAEEAYIEFYHLFVYPEDMDDVAFLLCAWNGSATHIVTHDTDLLDIERAYRSRFKICQPIPFLEELRSHIRE